MDFLQEVAAVPNEAGFIRFCTVFPHSVFGAPSAQRIVGVGPSFFRAVFFEDFGFNQLVVQVVEIVLHFAVGQLAVDQVAEVVVVIGRAVVGFQAVVGDGIEIVWEAETAWLPHPRYVGIGGFMRATACYD